MICQHYILYAYVFLLDMTDSHIYALIYVYIYTLKYTIYKHTVYHTFYFYIMIMYVFFLDIHYIIPILPIPAYLHTFFVSVPCIICSIIYIYTTLSDFQS